MNRRRASAADRLRHAAERTFGWTSLRPGQLRAMESVTEGRDTLVVMPTGAGKSAVYQVPALLLPGPTVVVSPLIALQRDQVAGLLRHGAPDAVAINSARGEEQLEEAWQSVRSGEAEYVFLSPEQLAKDEVVERLRAAGPSLFVVDEAQCVSTWGHDFRPDYLRLRSAAERVGRPPLLALTATAAPPVREEIVSALGMVRARQVVAGFDRPNLRLEVVRFLDDHKKRRAAVERAASLPKPGLVYVSTRKDAEVYAAELAGLGLTARAYHAGMKASDRARVHDGFLAGTVDVVAATSAFGMGIDKPDVRFVLHAAVPGSPDAYYQEIGRAGRDGGPAEAVLLYRPEDLGLQKFFAHGGPDRETLQDVVRRVRARREPASAGELREETGLTTTRLTTAVNLLERAGAVATTPEGRIAPGGTPAREGVRRALAAAEAHQRLERSRVEMMRGYAETTGCRRRFLLGYFGERLDEPCGHCDVCEAAAGKRREEEGVVAGAGATDGATNGAVTAGAVGRAGRYGPGTRVRHAEWGEGSVMSEGADRVTVLFESVGYRTLSLAAVAEGGLLDVCEAS